ncbi:hypothetical protein H5T58_01170 [Candidatus Parcubacteria bacterium]|nr:hypothetical protein [Candidatus Parcubacteria bacterium]
MPALAEQLLEVEEIREGTLIMRDGSLRGILLVSSLNFELVSQSEKEAIIYQFQNFLNSLEFSIQILVQSRKVNITHYLDYLKELEEKQTNDLLKLQTKNYREFVSEWIAGGRIMTKNFYVIVPFHPIGLKKKVGEKLKPEIFSMYKTQLMQRMEFVARGLSSCGVTAVPLSTMEVVDLLWSLYHPEEAEVGYHPSVPPELIT